MNDDPPRQSVTQKDVAKALGITQATVSLAMRGDSKIPLRRQQQIKALAESMGYRPSPAASALAHQRHSTQRQAQRGTLAWLNFWDDPAELRRRDEFNQYFLGAAQAADKFGFRLDEFSCGSSLRPQRLESILSARGIEGILLPPHPAECGIRRFNCEKFSLIKFGRSLHDPVGHTVSSDQLFNAMLAFNEIRKRGYKRIGFVNTSVDHWLFDAGFAKAQYAVPSSERLPILFLAPDRKENYKSELDPWIRKNRPDAIFTTAPELPELLLELGKRIPQDIGVAVASVLDGHADAGINQNPLEIGRVAVLALISLIHDNDRGSPSQYREILVKGAWVDGTSLPPRNAASSV